MKANRKLPLLCSLTLAALATTAFAQSAAPSPTDGKCQHAQKEGGRKLAKELNLTPEQKARLIPVHQKTKSDIEAIKADTTLTREQRKERIQAVRQARDQQLQAILTPEQFQKLQQIKAEHKAAKGGKPAGESA